MTNLEQEAHTARMMIEAGGKKAFVLIAEIQGDSAVMTRAISDGTSKKEALSWIGALNRERERVGKLIGVDPNIVKTTSVGS